MPLGPGDRSDVWKVDRSDWEDKYVLLRLKTASAILRSLLLVTQDRSLSGYVPGIHHWILDRDLSIINLSVRDTIFAILKESWSSVLPRF